MSTPTTTSMLSTNRCATHLDSTDSCSAITFTSIINTSSSSSSSSASSFEEEEKKNNNNNINQLEEKQFSCVGWMASLKKGTIDLVTVRNTEHGGVHAHAFSQHKIILPSEACTSASSSSEEDGRKNVVHSLVPCTSSLVLRNASPCVACVVSPEFGSRGRGTSNSNNNNNSDSSSLLPVSGIVFIENVDPSWLTEEEKEDRQQHEEEEEGQSSNQNKKKKKPLDLLLEAAEFQDVELQDEKNKESQKEEKEENEKQEKKQGEKKEISSALEWSRKRERDFHAWCSSWISSSKSSSSSSSSSATSASSSGSSSGRKLLAMSSFIPLTWSNNDGVANNNNNNNNNLVVSREAASTLEDVTFWSSSLSALLVGGEKGKVSIVYPFLSSSTSSSSNKKSSSNKQNSKESSSASTSSFVFPLLGDEAAGDCVQIAECATSPIFDSSTSSLTVSFILSFWNKCFILDVKATLPPSSSSSSSKNSPNSKNNTFSSPISVVLPLHNVGKTARVGAYGACGLWPQTSSSSSSSSYTSTTAAAATSGVTLALHKQGRILFVDSTTGNVKQTLELPKTPKVPGVRSIRDVTAVVDRKCFSPAQQQQQQTGTQQQQQVSPSPPWCLVLCVARNQVSVMNLFSRSCYAGVQQLNSEVLSALQETVASSSSSEGGGGGEGEGGDGQISSRGGGAGTTASARQSARGGGASSLDLALLAEGPSNVRSAHIIFGSFVVCLLRSGQLSVLTLGGVNGEFCKNNLVADVSFIERRRRREENIRLAEEHKEELEAFVVGESKMRTEFEGEEGNEFRVHLVKQEKTEREERKREAEERILQEQREEERKKEAAAAEEERKRLEEEQRAEEEAEALRVHQEQLQQQQAADAERQHEIQLAAAQRKERAALEKEETQSRTKTVKQDEQEVRRKVEVQRRQECDELVKKEKQEAIERQKRKEQEELAAAIEKERQRKLKLEREERARDEERRRKKQEEKQQEQDRLNLLEKEKNEKEQKEKEEVERQEQRQKRKEEKAKEKEKRRRERKLRKEGHSIQDLPKWIDAVDYELCSISSPSSGISSKREKKQAPTLAAKNFFSNLLLVIGNLCEKIRHSDQIQNRRCGAFSSSSSDNERDEDEEEEGDDEENNKNDNNNNNNNNSEENKLSQVISQVSNLVSLCRRFSKLLPDLSRFAASELKRPFSERRLECNLFTRVSVQRTLAALIVAPLCFYEYSSLNESFACSSFALYSLHGAGQLSSLEPSVASDPRLMYSRANNNNNNSTRESKNNSPTNNNNNNNNSQRNFHQNPSAASASGSSSSQNHHSYHTSESPDDLAFASATRGTIKLLKQLGLFNLSIAAVMIYILHRRRSLSMSVTLLTEFKHLLDSGCHVGQPSSSSTSSSSSSSSSPSSSSSSSAATSAAGGTNQQNNNNSYIAGEYLRKRPLPGCDPLITKTTRNQPLPQLLSCAMLVARSVLNPTVPFYGATLSDAQDDEMNSQSRSSKKQEENGSGNSQQQQPQGTTPLNFSTLAQDVEECIIAGDSKIDSFFPTMPDLFSKVVSSQSTSSLVMSMHQKALHVAKQAELAFVASGAAENESNSTPSNQNNNFNNNYNSSSSSTGGGTNNNNNNNENSLPLNPLKSALNIFEACCCDPDPLFIDYAVHVILTVTYLPFINVVMPTKATRLASATLAWDVSFDQSWVEWALTCPRLRRDVFGYLTRAMMKRTNKLKQEMLRLQQSLPLSEQGGISSFSVPSSPPLQEKMPSGMTMSAILCDQITPYLAQLPQQDPRGTLWLNPIQNGGDVMSQQKKKNNNNNNNNNKYASFSQSNTKKKQEQQQQSPQLNSYSSWSGSSPTTAAASSSSPLSLIDNSSNSRNTNTVATMVKKLNHWEIDTLLTRRFVWCLHVYFFEHASAMNKLNAGLTGGGRQQQQPPSPKSRDNNNNNYNSISSGASLPDSVASVAYVESNMILSSSSKRVGSSSAASSSANFGNANNNNNSNSSSSASSKNSPEKAPIQSESMLRRRVKRIDGMIDDLVNAIKTFFVFDTNSYNTVMRGVGELAYAFHHGKTLIEVDSFNSVVDRHVAIGDVGSLLPILNSILAGSMPLASSSPASATSTGGVQRKISAGFGSSQQQQQGGGGQNEITSREWNYIFLVARSAGLLQDAVHLALAVENDPSRVKFLVEKAFPSLRFGSENVPSDPQLAQALDMLTKLGAFAF